jgi:hypothetical protein
MRMIEEGTGEVKNGQIGLGRGSWENESLKTMTLTLSYGDNSMQRTF